MRRMFLVSACSLVLIGSMFSPSYSSAGFQRYPLIRRAINALRAARSDLQNAARDYCGHRVQALEATNAALNQLQQAVGCANARRNSAVGSEVPADTAGGGEPHPKIYRAINALGAAEGDLQNAAHTYCGHRVEALEAVRAAEAQLKLAIECDKR